MPQGELIYFSPSTASLLFLAATQTISNLNSLFQPYLFVFYLRTSLDHYKDFFLVEMLNFIKTFQQRLP